MKPNPNLFLHPCCILLLICLLPACSSVQPRPVASYSTYLNDSQVAARQMVPMSNEEANRQKSGTTVTKKTASSETLIKNGKIKKQTSTNEEQIESETSTVVETLSIPAADQDMR